MEFFNSAVGVLQTLVVALGAGLGIWGVINLLEGYGQDNPASKSQGMKQLMAGGGVALIGITLVCAVLIVTNTWNIVMGIFDVGQSVVNSSAGVIIGNTSIDISSVITDMEAQLEALGTGELFGLWFQSLFVGLTMNALSICIMLVIYGRMIEVYLTTSVGPIPLATMTNRDWSHTGQNYLKSLFALAFQAFLIMVCVGIYSVLVQSIATDGNISGAIWACMGYTVLLCFALFKTGSLSKSLFGAH